MKAPLSGIPKFQLKYFNLSKEFSRHQEKMKCIFKRNREIVES
jgi:hypothetical protein